MSLNLKSLENNKHISKDKSSNKLLNSLLKSRTINIFSGNKLSDKKREQMFSELGMLINSGLDLSTSIKLIVDQEKNKTDQSLLSSLHIELIKGLSLSEAIQKTEKFSTYDFYTLKIGEESGKLGESVYELSTFYRKKIKYRRMIISAVSYPILVLISAVVALVFMLKYLVPAFSDIFQRANNDLPSITRFVINLSDIFSKGIYYLLVFIIILVVIYIINRKKDWLKSLTSRFLLGIPLFGSIFRVFYLERLFISMVLLIKSNVSLVNAISLSKKMNGFYLVEQALNQIEIDITKGLLLSESMRNYKIFDRKLITLIKVGEEVNKLDSVFERLSQQYSNELNYKIESIAAFLEPILILTVGFIVAIILVAMYLPIFQMGGAIQ
jgi:type IV pilus assembly protein PilC